MASKAGRAWRKIPLTLAISCQQVGPIELTDKIKNGKSQGDVVFQKRTSLVFKKLQVVRFYDAKAQCAGLSDLLG